MGRQYFYVIIAAAVVGLVTLTFTNNNNVDHVQHRALSAKQQEAHFDARQRRAMAKLAHPNETITSDLSIAAHSYCDGNDLVEYPLPKYDACPPDSTLNVIPFFGGMTNALKFIILGGLLSFEENRCFIVSEKDAHLNPGHRFGKTADGEMGNFVDHFFEQIGLPHDHPFVKTKLESGDFQVRDWKEYWTGLKERRTSQNHYDYNTPMFSHPVSRVDGVTLKRDFIRHVWHLLPSYRDSTCQALKDAELFDTDYIAMSIRRGDKTKENFGSKFPSVGSYVVEADNLVPHVFKDGQRPKIFLATDDCQVVDTFRKSRPQYTFVSACEDLVETQLGYDILDIPKMNQEQREEHFRKFFIELYALALSKVYIGVAYTNVAWWAFMMRPTDKETFLLIDESVQGQDTLNYW